MRHILLAGIATLTFAAAAQAQMSPGQALFDNDCAICHLANGAGGVHFGDAVSANLTAPHLETLYHNSDTLILRAILRAKDQDGAPLDMPMPAWSGRLSTAEAAQILSYLKTLHS